MSKPARTILERLLADVDDVMEFQGTWWQTNAQAANGVRETLNKAQADLLAGLLTAMPKKRVEHTVVGKNGKMLHDQKRNIGFNDGIDSCVRAITNYFTKTTSDIEDGGKS